VYPFCESSPGTAQTDLKGRPRGPAEPGDARRIVLRRKALRDVTLDCNEKLLLFQAKEAL